MLRIVDKDEKTIGYECSECRTVLLADEAVCENCGRALNYSGLMPSTKRWERLNTQEREKDRENAFQLTVAIVRAYGSDWRDLMSPFHRFILNDETLQQRIDKDPSSYNPAWWVLRTKERFIQEELAQCEVEIFETAEEKCKGKRWGRNKYFWQCVGEIRQERKQAIQETLEQEAHSVVSREEYSLAETMIVTAERVKEIASQLPPQLIHAQYMTR